MKIQPELVDGSDMAFKERRNELFDISGIRGKYPQFFLVKDEDGPTTFLGDFDTFEWLNDEGTLLQAING